MCEQKLLSNSSYLLVTQAQIETMHVLTQTSSSKVDNWKAPHLSGLLKKLKWNP